MARADEPGRAVARLTGGPGMTRLGSGAAGHGVGPANATEVSCGAWALRHIPARQPPSASPGPLDPGSGILLVHRITLICSTQARSVCRPTVRRLGLHPAQ